MVRKHLGLPKTVRCWLGLLLVAYARSGQATSVAIIQGKDYVVVAADGKETVVVNGKVVGTQPGCKIHKAGGLYFAIAGIRNSPEYDAKRIGAAAAALSATPDDAALRFETAIEPRLRDLLAAMNANPGDPSYQRVKKKNLILAVAFVSMRGGTPAFSVRSFRWRLEGRRYVLAPTESGSCKGPCSKGHTVIRMGDNAEDDADASAVHDVSSASAAAMNLVRWDASAYPDTVGEPFVELVLDSGGAHWLPEENLCNRARTAKSKTKGEAPK